MGLPPPDQHRNRIQMQSCNKKKKKTQKTSLQKRKRNCLKQQHKSTRSKLTSSADADCCCTTVWFHVVTGAGKGWQARTILRICKRDKRTLRKISLAFYIFAPHQQRLLAVLCVKYIVPYSTPSFIVFFFLFSFILFFFSSQNTQLGEGILTATESFCTFLRPTTFNRNSTPNEQHQASRSAVYTDEAAVTAAFVAL